MFSVYLSVHQGGGGTSGPTTFWGGAPLSPVNGPVSCPLPGPAWGEGYPQPRWGTPSPSQDRVPPPRPEGMCVAGGMLLAFVQDVFLVQ